jgi:hypothetical protein
MSHFFNTGTMDVHSVAAMEFYELMREAARGAVTVVEGVKPDRLGDPTPCEDWNVGALIEHLATWVVHGWDLARATGQEPVVGEDLAAATLEAVTMTAEQGRAYGILGPEVTVPASASTLDRALAMSGRDPYPS